MDVIGVEEMLMCVQYHMTYNVNVGLFMNSRNGKVLGVEIVSTICLVYSKKLTEETVCYNSVSSEGGCAQVHMKPTPAGLHVLQISHDLSVRMVY